MPTPVTQCLRAATLGERGADVGAGDVEVALAAWMVVLLGFAAVVGVVSTRRRSVVATVTGEFEELKATVDAFERRYSLRLESLRDHLIAAEGSTLRAEADATAAADGMRWLRYDLRRRLETIEPQQEIDLLVTEGRLPVEHSLYPRLF